MKTPAEYKVVATAVPRNDLPDKVSGKYVYMQHVRVPGMLHGRVVRPRGQGAYGAGAKVLALDESSIRNIPGARVLRKGDFVGVVAENEWDAVRAARQLKVTWDTTPSLSGSDGLYEAMRAVKTDDRIVLNGAMRRTRSARLRTKSLTVAALPIKRMLPSGRTARSRT